jgi:hypothetical protein
MLNTKNQIEQIRQQIEAADPEDRRRLQHQLKDLQILQLWQLSLADNSSVVNFL